MKKTILLLILLLAGCASLDRGGAQELQVFTRNDAGNGKTLCTLVNDDGYWKVKPVLAGSDNAFGEKVVVNRDGETMRVRCENDTQLGVTQAKSTFDKKYFFQDLFSVCLFCVVDAATGAFFSYPDIIYVDMAAR